MQFKLTIKGMISGQLTHLHVQTDDLDLNLLDFLSQHQIAIASSCRGQQVCEKCIINNKELCCSYTVKEYLKNKGEIIEVDYL